MSRIDDPKNMQERAFKLASEKISQFHYKSLHSFKEKINPEWEMMYIAYDSSLDLVYLPMALEKVVKF